MRKPIRVSTETPIVELGMNVGLAGKASLQDWRPSPGDASAALRNGSVGVRLAGVMGRFCWCGGRNARSGPLGHPPGV